jgi:uncharacterized cupredoxin-like copper-binding protein
MFLKTVPVLLFVGAAAFVTSSTVHDTRAAKIPVVTVHAKDFAFDAPKTIAAGMTSFKLVNDGKMLHHLQIMKLEQGKTFADLQAAMKDPAAPPPTWLVSVGGPNAAVPGNTIEATLNLEAGNYVIACFIPSPGDPAPHFTKGMIQPLTVTAASGVAQEGAAMVDAPTPTVHLVLKDYGFAFSKPLHAGKNVIHVMNEGPQEHEAVFVKLAPGKHIADVNTWVTQEGMKGPPPGTPIDGMASLAKGRTGIFTANLTPGTYGLICFAPDAKDHKEHSLHGMTSEFTVR